MPILIDLIITIAAYMTIPIIITSCKRYTISKKEIQKAVIINAVCAWIIFAIIAVNQGRTPGAAGLLWAWVCYFICKKISFEE
jgi:hypothetical protein